MANFILGYLVIGLLFSFLYIWRVEETEVMRSVSKKKYTAALCFTTTLITLFWLPIGVFAIISVVIKLRSEAKNS